LLRAPTAYPGFLRGGSAEWCENMSEFVYHRGEPA
jgi:hypothetical protein